jgi:hypothetical protein
LPNEELHYTLHHDELEEGEIGGACSTYERLQMRITFLSENKNEKEVYRQSRAILVTGREGP